MGSRRRTAEREKAKGSTTPPLFTHSQQSPLDRSNRRRRGCNCFPNTTRSTSKPHPLLVDLGRDTRDLVLAANETHALTAAPNLLIDLARRLFLFLEEVNIALREWNRATTCFQRLLAGSRQFQLRRPPVRRHRIDAEKNVHRGIA